GAEADAGADPFPDQGAYTRLSDEEARRLFGATELTRELGAAPVGRWSGPYRSGYGWHLVHVDVRDLAGRPPFETVRERVREDWLHDAQAAANAAAIQRLRDRYTVVRRDLEAAR
ncbi:MAG: peptidyl-prolyl cis-trans isomerase, partial [Phenylobacterium sp.]|nr:peptidyl-prolyl cis-trans isomerase [Phenylobacterium sp.]